MPHSETLEWLSVMARLEDGAADGINHAADAAAIIEGLTSELDEAEAKAWDSLSRYKFQMFGYWSAIWVHLNRLGNFKRPNPWKSLVRIAKDREAQQ